MADLRCLAGHAHVEQQLIKALFELGEPKGTVETEDPDALGNVATLAQVIGGLAEGVDEPRAVGVVANDADGFMPDDGLDMNLVVV